MKVTFLQKRRLLQSCPLQAPPPSLALAPCQTPTSPATPGRVTSPTVQWKFEDTI